MILRQTKGFDRTEGERVSLAVNSAHRQL